MATIHHDGSDRMPDLALGDTLVLANTGISGSFMPRGWRYRGEKTFDGYGSTITETIGFDNFNDIPLQRMEEADDAEPIGRYIFVKYPATTPQWLAVAVIKGEPCGRELLDCLIEEGVIDPHAESIKAAKIEALEEVVAMIHRVDDETHHDDRVGYLLHDIATDIVKTIGDLRSGMDSSKNYGGGE